jgi:maltose phosphorylase
MQISRKSGICSRKEGLCMKRLFAIDPWKLKMDALNKEEKRLQESLTSIGNGYMGMRGNFEEGYSGDTHEGTYLAGVWYPDKTRVGWWKNGYPEYFGKVINAMNFIAVGILIDGEPLDLAKQTVADFRMELDMRRGVLDRSFIWKNEDAAEVKFTFQRFVSIAQKELCLVRVTAEVLKGSVDLEVHPRLDGNVTNEDANYEEIFWEEAGRTLDAPVSLSAKTIPNPFGVEQFTVTAAMSNRLSGLGQTGSNESGLLVEETFSGIVSAGQKAVLDKHVAVITSRDIPDAEQAFFAKKLADEAAETGYAALLAAHERAWEERWTKADVQILGDDEAQQGIRFNLFQLFSTYYGEDERLNIGPKGFTGEKYGGATYWDTEAYMVPMYLSVAEPRITRQLLRYRHQQLPGAYHNARQQGLKGALYPMVTFTGIECHNEWEITFEEIHRNGAIAYAIYNYTNYTGDESYLVETGIDVLIGISRFWADRVHFSKRKQKYMIHGVTGPNEYENNVNNNYHTNNMATWTLQYTLDALKKVSTEKWAEHNLTEAETAHWKDIIARMYYPYDEELGVFVQHDTFLDKDLRPADSLDPSERPLNQNWSWDKILRSPFIKQADVLQSIFFLNDRYTLEEKRRNFDFYEPMTVHESSLSPSVHAVLAAELGKEEKAVELYSRTARLDLDNYNNDTDDGLHITSMSGAWLAIVQGFAGMRVKEGILHFKPFVPKEWLGYDFKINFRGSLLAVKVNGGEVALTVEAGPARAVCLYDEWVQVEKNAVIKMRV